MGRVIGAILAGYVVIFVIVFTTLSLAFLVIGVSGVFRPGSYEVSGLWIAVSFVLGFLAALAGGWTAAAVGKNSRALNGLAILVLVIGIALAIPAAGQRSAPAPRPDTVSNMQAMQQARTPFWIALLNPLVGAAGVLIAGRRKLRSEPAV